MVEAVAAFACQPRVDGCWRAAIPDTEAGPMPLGLLARLRRVRHDPQSSNRSFAGARHHRVDARAQVLMRSAMPGPCASRMSGSHVVSIDLFDGRVPRNLEWTDQGPSDGKASIAFPQRLGRLFSPAAKRRHSSRTKKAVFLCVRPRPFAASMAGPWPGEAIGPAASAEALAEDAGRRLFVPRGMPPLGGRGKKKRPSRCGKSSRCFAVTRALIRPFEVAWDAPIKQINGDHMTADIA